MADKPLVGAQADPDASPAPRADAADLGNARWTPAQAAAIEHVAGDLLISAAAGSGKTAVLSERCARLVTRGDAGKTSVDRLLVLTFTDAAANEMRTRIGEALRQKLLRAHSRAAAELQRQIAMLDRASISTLHVFCGRTLRSYFHEAQVDPSFEIIDADEAKLLHEEILQEVLDAWHRKAASTASGMNASAEAADAADFAELYEAFAQGKDSVLIDQVTALDAMLASVKDPAEWLAAARGVYSETGAPATRDRYIARQAGELSLLVTRYDRQLAELARIDGCDHMARILRGWRDTLADAAADLHARGVAAWDLIGPHLEAFTFETLTTNHAVSNFAAIKKRIFEKAKQDKQKLVSQTFTPLQSAAQLLADLRRLERPLDTLIRLTLDFQRAYATAKRTQNRLDFADLERLTLDLLTRPGSHAARELRRRFDQILIDEFQDINPLQAALLEAVRDDARHDGRGNLFVVGDVKQSIYGFRLADPGEFLQREQTARARPGAFLALQHNFRSRPALLGHLNVVFERLLTPAVAGIDYAQDHALHPPESPAPEEAPPDPRCRPFTGTPIECHIAFTDAADSESAEAENAGEPAAQMESAGAENDAAAKETGVATLAAMEQEAQMLAARLVNLMREQRCVREKSGRLRPLEYRDIAILLRGVRRRAPFFTHALAERGIPVHADLSTGFFDAEEVRFTLAYLNLLDNPLQDIPLVTAMLSPFGRFSHDDLARLRLAFPRKLDVPFHDAVRRVLNGDPPEGDPALVMADPTLFGRLKAFFANIDRHRRRARSLPLPEALAELYQETHLLTYVSGLPAGEQRVANLQALHQRAMQFSTFRRQGLHRFLRFIERLREMDGDFGEAPVLSEASNVVRIMTIHKSKGLEFPVVFVSTLGAQFASDTGGPVLVDRDEYVGLQVADVQRNLFRPSAASWLITQRRRRATRAEELRLLYVAMTRAREQLILTGAAPRSIVERLTAVSPGAPLPADLLLRGRCFLDYLLPLTADPALKGQLLLHTHEPVAPTPPPAETSEVHQRLLAFETHRPFETVPLPAEPLLASLIQRLTGRYAYQPLTELPALVSVSELKKRYAESLGDEPPPFDLAPSLRRPAPAAIAARTSADVLPQPQWRFTNEASAAFGEAARARGVATHRVLECLDFHRVVDRPTLESAITALVEARRLSADQAALVARDDILWFLHTPLGRRLHDAVDGASAAESPLFADLSASRLWREISFVHALSPEEVPDARHLPSENPARLADATLLRGIIDLLLLNPEHAEIIDYKTDAPALIDAHLPGYQLQMRYYARAAARILGRPVPNATLVFLSARELRSVKLDPVSDM